MPAISRFYGIKVKMYQRDHPPPHFHAHYAEHAGSFTIETLEVLAGRLPRRVQALVLEWAMLNRPALRENWRRSERGASLLAIPGLDEEA